MSDSLPPMLEIQGQPIFYALLPDHSVVPTDLDTWSRFLVSHERFVDQTLGKDVFVSTIFFGLDRDVFNLGKPPLLFETIVFRSDGAGDTKLAATWDEAVANHKAMVEYLRATGEL